MSDDYELVQRGSLKLKKSSLSVEPSIKKKKKKKKSAELKQAQAVAEKVKADEEGLHEEAASTSGSVKRKADANKKTKAEIAFQKTKEERMVKEMTSRVSKSHKERIMDFNQYLDQLSEHYDIPKVSWTK